jgi:hypothetical protein
LLIIIPLTPERQLLAEIGRSPDFPRKARLPGFHPIILPVEKRMGMGYIQWLL